MADSLELTRLINKNSPTVVSAWNLQKPLEIKTSKNLRFPRTVESLGAEGDRRTKAPIDSFTLPGGKYRAICKLYMAYQHLPEKEFIGTGWLIANNLIVTAGHCVYDWDFNGGFLKYVKVYFGYNGPDSVNDANTVYRYGAISACPAEYLQAKSFPRDVGFIRLNKSVDVEDIKPFVFVDTPNNIKLNLSVVGYPGDLDFGHIMYEHKKKVDIDLVRTSGLLSYEIDTTGGQSGSPVLWFDHKSSEYKAIGVHVAGGFPNVGSTIGFIGNKFEEYLLALSVRHGESSPLVETVKVGAESTKADGFQLIFVKPSSSSKSTNAASGIQNGVSNGASKDDDDDDDEEDEDDEDEVAEAEAETENALDALFGKPIKKQKPQTKNSKSSVAKGKFLSFPERLRLEESDSATPTVPNYDAAVAKATENQDIQTVFFVNFPPKLEAAARKPLKKLMNSIQSWQSWSSTISEGKVQEQIDKGALPADNSGKSTMARSSYRSKVFDYLMRRSSWFAKTFDQNISKYIKINKLEFHTAILTAVLEGFSVPTTVFSQLEKVLQTISNGVLEIGRNNSSESQQYWIMLTRYEYEPLTETIRPIIRVISFQISQQVQEYTFGKSKYTEVEFTLDFNQYQTDFNAKIYEKVQKSIDERLVDLGTELVLQKTFDIEV